MKRVIAFLLTISTCFAVSPTITSFTNGQVTPNLEARVDWDGYKASSRTVENMLVTVHGPVERRSGTKYIATAKSGEVRLIPFEYSTEDAYVIEGGNIYFRFYRDGGQILDGVGTEDISGLDNVIAHWLLNETSGTVVADDDGGTHDGTSSVDTETLNATGKVGAGSFDLDGQYTVTVSDSSDFSFTDNSDDTPFSIVCWGLVTEQGDTQVLMSKWQDESTAKEWRLSLDGQRKLQLHISDTSASLSANRVAQWKLNDNAATQAVDDDVAVVPHDGVLTPSNTEDVTAVGLTNMTPCFDFSASEAVEVSDNAALSFGNGTVDSPFSISAWVFVTDTIINQRILSKYNQNAKREWMLQMTADEKIRVDLADQSESAYPSREMDNPLSTGWHHIVSVYAGQSTSGSTAADFITIYVDGSVVDSTAFNIANYDAMEDLTGKVAIGANYDGTGTLQAFWADKIDNVILFDIALTSSNVSVLWNGGNGTEALTSSTPTPFSVSDSAVDLGWHLFTATYSAPSDETAAADGIILYVDGAVVSSTATNDVDYTAMQNGAEEVRIGSQRNTGDTANEKFWGDKIDEISVYGDVLTPIEVASLHSTAAYEIATVFDTDEIFNIQYAQTDNSLYLVDGTDPPQLLTREGHTLWTIEDVDFQTGPFLLENDTATTISADAITGGVTLTASANVFQATAGASHIGSLWQINQVRESSTITGDFTANGVSISTPRFAGDYGFTTNNSGGPQWTGTVTLQRSTNGGTSWRAALVALTDTNFNNPAEFEEDGAIYRVVMSGYGSNTCTYTITITDNVNNGIVRITGVQSATSATGTVLNDLVTANAAVTTWSEGYWSDFRGWPKTVTFHQQRLVFGGSESYPQTIWFGKQDPDDYANFLEGTLDTSAFTIALPGQNPIRWLFSQDYLLIGTSGSCGKYGTQGASATPTSPDYQQQTPLGADAFSAIQANTGVLYVERGGRKIREFGYKLASDKYESDDVTVLSPEITKSGIKDIAFQLRPDPILWCVLNDGDIATLTYKKSQAVIAWTKQLTDGDFESVTVISSGDQEDEVWVSVKRVINSNTVRYIEQFQPRDFGSDVNDAWFVDSGLSYNGVATDTFTGADHLEAEILSIYSDRLIESPETVVSGGFTIDNAASRVLVGMPYTSKLETLPLMIDPQDKVANKKIRRVWFDVRKTGALSYGNGADSTLTVWNFKNDLDVDPNATAQDWDVYPGTSVVKPLDSMFVYGSRKKLTVYVETAQPVPMTIRSITPSYDLFGN